MVHLDVAACRIGYNYRPRYFDCLPLVAELDDLEPGLPNSYMSFLEGVSFDQGLNSSDGMGGGSEVP